MARLLHHVHPDVTAGSSTSPQLRRIGSTYEKADDWQHVALSTAAEVSSEPSGLCAKLRWTTALTSNQSFYRSVLGKMFHAVGDNS